LGSSATGRTLEENLGEAVQAIGGFVEGLALKD